MKIKAFEFNMFGEMTYVVYDNDGGEAAIIDPGMLNDREEDILDHFIKEHNLRIRHIIATHLHVDHVMGLNRLSKKTKLGVEANGNDSFLATRIAEQIKMFHLPVDTPHVEIEHELNDGDKIKIGTGILEVMCIPGHSPGSIALYSPADGFIITGDALFKQSIGRTDLPGGDYSTLIKSISEKLMTLSDSTVVYPGHGPATTIGYERKFNPYV